MRVAHAAVPAELGKLRWRCRRGMQELDILLARYVEVRFSRAGSQEQEAFRRLLDTQDTLLYAYCMGQLKPPDELAALIDSITAYPSAGS